LKTVPLFAIVLTIPSYAMFLVVYAEANSPCPASLWKIDKCNYPRNIGSHDCLQFFRVRRTVVRWHLRRRKPYARQSMSWWHHLGLDQKPLVRTKRKRSQTSYVLVFNTFRNWPSGRVFYDWESCSGLGECQNAPRFLPEVDV